MNGKRKGDHLNVDEKAAKRLETKQSTAPLSTHQLLHGSSETDSTKKKNTDLGEHHNGSGNKNGNGNGNLPENIPLQQQNRNGLHKGYKPNGNGKVMKHPVEAHHSVLPLTMQLMKPFWSIGCDRCSTPEVHRYQHRYEPISTPPFIGQDGEIVNSNSLYCGFIEQTQPEPQESSAPPNENDITRDDGTGQITVDNRGRETEALLSSQKDYKDEITASSGPRQRKRSAEKSHLESISPSPRDHTLSVLSEYIAATKMYGCVHVNSGVLTTLRFSLPTLRVSGNFHDSDMLALSEVLFRHCNGALKHIRRLDFSIAGRYGKLYGRKGFGSHGAFTLSRVLCISKHIEEVFLQRNQIGPYGSAAIFAAVAKNRIVKLLIMRRCMVGEKGALAFAEHIGKSDICGLREVDLSVNSIGFRGSITIEQLLIEKEDQGNKIEVDLEGNLVIQEIMNGVTHGLGVILCIIGACLLSSKVTGGSHNEVISCGAYSISLLVLYISSTLYHSFFALKYTRYIFECLDHCAIYILITGSYTPFLRIALQDKPQWSFYLLIFLYLCCAGGVFVEAFHNTWVHKPKFTLAMYLGMGWSCLICMPDLMEVLPKKAINLIIYGGVGYTSGVPFFVRNNNLDHSIWHCFVLAGSMFHWFCIYLYVVPQNSITDVK